MTMLSTTDHSIHEVFTRDVYSLCVTFPTTTQLDAYDMSHDGEVICDRDQFIIELVRQIARHNEAMGATVLSVDRVLKSTDATVEVSYDTFEFIDELLRWLMQHTYIGSITVKRNFMPGI